MLVLSEQQSELTEFAEDAGIPLNGCAAGLEEISPQARHRDRILAIRRQLEEGTYDLDGRLDALLERLLAIISE